MTIFLILKLTSNNSIFGSFVEVERERGGGEKGEKENEEKEEERNDILLTQL